jgi:hypothetical protein
VIDFFPEDALQWSRVECRQLVYGSHGGVFGPIHLFRPLGYPDDPVQFPTFEAALDKSRFGFESGSRGPFWQGRELAAMQAIFGAGLDGSRSVLGGLRAISS